MPDKAWKQFERVMAAIYGGIRRGADFGGGPKGDGKTDVIHPFWAIECKLLGAPSFSAMLAACRQAEKNAEPGQCPIAVIKRKNQRVENTLVVMRLPVHIEWYGGTPPDPEDNPS